MITVFYNNFIIRDKLAIRKHLLEFISKYKDLYTIKKCISSVEKDIPKLFGFEKATIMMHNDKIKSLYYICLDDDIDKIYKANNPPGFECDYRVQSSQVVDYPTNMGISGFCFKNDSICFINGFDSDYNKETPPRAFCLGKKRLSKFGQCLLAKYLLKDFPYNSKIDNLTN